MNRKYKYLLWDIDDTLIDFKASQNIALQQCFTDYGIVLTQKDIQVYNTINKGYWRRLEEGTIEKSVMLQQRFQDFIQYLSVDGLSAKDINTTFQVCIGESAVLYEGAYELCLDAKSLVQQYVITNGTRIAQEIKLRQTGLDQVLDGIFISDDVGYQKPDIRFFQHVELHIPNFKKEEALVIGDSLTSDMQGANGAGIDCCWFNPQGKVREEHGIVIHYEIQSLEEVRHIIRL
ncbi:MAG: YjjG family noncanonical pyrimidine nucleotidase [Eubacteriales bacterium]